MEKAKPQLTIPCSPFFFISFFIICFHCSEISAQPAKTTAVPVGVILNLTSETGKGCMTSILIALEDFYAANPNYSTRVHFSFWDSMGRSSKAAYIASYLTGSWMSCNSSYGASVENLTGDCLMKFGERNVEAIMGTQSSSEARTVASICDQTQVPFISFSTATSRMLIRANLDYSSESLPIANLSQHFNWTSIVHVFEEYGASIFKSLDPNVTGTEIPRFIEIPLKSSDSQIEGKLKLMMNFTTRVFLVHVVSPQAVRIFQLADKLGMMSKGYVWIVTSTVGDILNTLQAANLSSMNGVVGFRTTDQSDKERKRLKDFSKTYKERLQKDYNIKVENPTMYQLWAYDAAWAVAMAVEKTKISDPSFAVPPLNGSLKHLTKAIRSTNFSEGLAGNFGLVDGQRQFSAYEILNVVDNVTRSIGFWSQQYGITQSKNSPAESNYTLKVRWPGNLTEPPKSETYSSTTLKIGIPVKRAFNESLGEYSISVFKAAADLLPKQLNYTFVKLNSTSNPFEDLMRDSQEELDGIVGDIIIPENDTEAYFTKQYMEGGVQMLVLIKQDTSSMNMWTFLRPFPLKLWIVSIAFFVFTGLAIWVTEHRVNPNFGAGDSFIRQLGNTFYFAFSTLVYSHDGSLKSNLSRILLIIWLFVVFVLTASYSASLSAILTVEKLKPAVNNIDDLSQNGVYVGCQEGSIVCVVLTQTFRFSESQIRRLPTDKFADALITGSDNGGVSAIFDVGPYLTLFLNQKQNRCNFTIVGPTYQSNGFGFAFKQTDLVNDLSKAIFNINVTDLKNIYFKRSECGNENSDNESHTVSFTSFGGLFIITGVVSSLMVIISLMRYVHKNKNHLKNILRDNNVTVRDRISALWKSFLSLESLEAGDSNDLCTNLIPRTGPPEGDSPLEMQEINKGR